MDKIILHQQIFIAHAQIDRFAFHEYFLPELERSLEFLQLIVELPVFGKLSIEFLPHFLKFALVEIGIIVVKVFRGFLIKDKENAFLN